MRLSRSGAGVVLLASLAAALTWPDAGAAARTLGGDDFPSALLGIAELGLAALAAWILAIAAAGVLRLPVPGAPRVLQAVLFAAVASTLALPAHADESHDLTGLPLPDRPTTAVVAAPIAPETAAVTVRTGDTLWAIAARTLPSDATAAAVDAEWRRWYRTNRAVVGPDPGLILPGQVLHPPREDAS